MRVEGLIPVEFTHVVAASRHVWRLFLEQCWVCRKEERRGGEEGRGGEELCDRVALIKSPPGRKMVCSGAHDRFL